MAGKVVVKYPIGMCQVIHLIPCESIGRIRISRIVPFRQNDVELSERHHLPLMFVGIDRM